LISAALFEQTIHPASTYESCRGQMITRNIVCRGALPRDLRKINAYSSLELSESISSRDSRKNSMEVMFC
jgi:hypothetical protein